MISRQLLLDERFSFFGSFTENPLHIIEISKQMAKYNLKVILQKTEITTLTPTSLNNIKTKKLETYLTMDKEISHSKALTLIAMNKL